MAVRRQWPTSVPGHEWCAPEACPPPIHSNKLHLYSEAQAHLLSLSRSLTGAGRLLRREQQCTNIIDNSNQNGESATERAALSNAKADFAHNRLAGGRRNNSIEFRWVPWPLLLLAGWRRLSASFSVANAPHKGCTPPPPPVDSVSSAIVSFELGCSSLCRWPFACVSIGSKEKNVQRCWQRGFGDDADQAEPRKH